MRVKNKIFLVIAFIIIVGSSLTAYTKYYLDHEANRPKYSENVTKADNNTEARNFGSSAQPDPVTDSEINADSEILETSPTYAAAPKERAVLSADSGIGDEALSESTEKAEAANLLSPEEAYHSKLQELEKQIKKVWDEETDSTTYAIKNTADYELAAWNQELNTIYQMLKDILTDDEFYQLRQEEREWLKERDLQAAQTARQYEGGSLEGIEYAKAAAALTRERTYELVSCYFEALMEQNASLE